MAFVVFTVDAERGMGYRGVSNEEVAESAAAHADVAIPFASIDPQPRRGRGRLAKRLIKEYRREGLQVPSHGAGLLRRTTGCAYPLYEAIAEAGLPALFHTGQTGIGAGMPGGGGLRLKYSNPMLLDDVAADFPTMPIVLAHPSFPWQDEALVGGDPQAEGLHRPLRLVAEVLPAEAGAVRQHAAEGQGAVRHRQPRHPSRTAGWRISKSSRSSRRCDR